MPPKDTTEVDQAVGARIAAVRKAKGVTLIALGEAVGVTFQQIMKYEKGHNRVGAGRLQEIAKFLDVPIADLFRDDFETVEQTDTFAFLSVPGAIELLTAFVAIENVQLRRDVLALARIAARMSAQAAAKNA